MLRIRSPVGLGACLIRGVCTLGATAPVHSLFSTAFAVLQVTATGHVRLGHRHLLCIYKKGQLREISRGSLVPVMRTGLTISRERDNYPKGS